MSSLVPHGHMCQLESLSHHTRKISLKIMWSFHIPNVPWSYAHPVVLCARFYPMRVDPILQVNP